jgi:hypothetical protein
LAPNVLDEALNELIFLRHVKSIEGVEKLIRSETENAAGVKKAIQVLAIIDDDEALHTLARLANDDKLGHIIRRSALHALTSNRSETAQQILKDFAEKPGPFAEEVSAQLKKAAAGK